MAKPTRRSLPLNPYSETPVEDWIQQLRDADSIEDRYRAFIAVTELLAPAEAMNPVVETLADSSGDLRAAAAHWLAQSALKDRLALDESARSRIAEALAPLLQDADPDVQLAAARALGIIAPGAPGLTETIVRLFNRDDAQPTSFATLAELCSRVSIPPDRILPHLRTLLTAEQADVREAAALAIRELGDGASAALPELVQALDDEEPLVREYAASALGRLGSLPDEAVAGLKNATQDEDEMVAAAAQAALRAHGR